MTVLTNPDVSLRTFSKEAAADFARVYRVDKGLRSLAAGVALKGYPGLLMKALEGSDQSEVLRRGRSVCR